MDTDNWARLKTIFNEALKLDPKERSEFLDKTCNDPKLRKKIESLLNADSKSEEFMETPAAADSSTTLVDSRIGQYKIEDIISSGGMGMVYKAIQENPKRTVAIKVMSRGLTSKSAVRRFEYESQILAQLRRHILDCANQLTDVRVGGGEGDVRIRGPGHAKINHLYIAFRIHQNVGGLQIPMYHAFLVTVVDTVTDLNKKLKALGHIEFAAGRIFCNGFSVLNMLHHKIGGASRVL